jgi:hypothetical protein
MNVAPNFNRPDPEIYRLLRLAIDGPFLLADDQFRNAIDQDVFAKAEKAGLIRHAEANGCFTGFDLTTKGRTALGLPVGGPSVVAKAWISLKSIFSV